MLIDALRSYRRRLGLTLGQPKPRRRRAEPIRFAAAAERLENRALLSAVQFFTTHEGVDWISVGAGGIGGYRDGTLVGDASASLNVDGVQGEIVAGYLYWQGIDNTYGGGDGIYDNEIVNFAGTEVTGVSIGSGSNGNWGPGSSQAFRADVTDLLLTGNQDYLVTGLASKMSHNANGASLIVVYQDGDRSNDRDLYILDGNHVSLGQADGRWSVHLGDFLYRGKDVRAQFHVADGQAHVEPALRFSTRNGANYPYVIQDQAGLFDGTSVRDEGQSRAINGSLWDVHTLDVTQAFNNPFSSPGPQHLSMWQDAYPSSYDSLTLVAILYDTTAARFNNTAPVAHDQSVTTPEGVQYTGDLSGTDADDDRLAFEIVTHPTNGRIYSWGNGRFSYTPNSEYNGTDAFTFRVFDGTDWSNVATVTITVTPNAPPVIANQSFNLNEDTPLSGQIAASDPDSDPLTFFLVGGYGPTNGSVQVNRDGTFLYAPKANFFGTDSFRVRVFDGAVSSFATVTLNVSSINDSPVAVTDSYTVAEDTTLRVAAVQSAQLSMTSDTGDWIGQGKTYSYSQFANFTARTIGGRNGVAILYQNPLNTSDYWRLEFTAPDDEILQLGRYTGVTRYPFNDGAEPGLSVSGQHRGCNTLTGEFTILRLVYAADGSIAEFEATFIQHCEGGTPALRGTIAYTAAGNGPSVLSNDSDVDGDSLMAVLVNGPQHGTLNFNSNGSFHYTPKQNFYGTDSFTYRAFDGDAYSDPVTVTITVTPVNDAPVATETLSFSGDEDQPITGQLTASDIDSPSLGYYVNQWPANGQVVINTDGTFTYTPRANFAGTDTFGFFVRDGLGAFDTATVTVVVNPVNDPPVAASKSFEVREGRELTNFVSATDVEGASLTYQLVTNVAHGLLILNSDGTFTYTPAAGFSGNDSFQFVAFDGNVASAPATVGISVLFNAPPAVTGPTTFVIPERSPNGTVVGTLQASDADSDPLSFTIVGGTGQNAFAIANDGQITVLDSSQLRYAINPSLSLLVNVSDGFKTTEVNLTINLEKVVLPAKIDIKPGDSGNSVQLNRETTIQVAILGSADLNVRNVVLESLTFGVTGDENSLTRHKKHGWLTYEFRDVNGDGREDLIVTFDIAKTGLTEGTLNLTLQGRLIDGTEFAGTDSITATSGGRPPKNRR